MAKDAVLQVRMDNSLKEAAEALFKEKGTTFAEAVRSFASACVARNDIPIAVRSNPRKLSHEASAAGCLSFGADKKLIPSENTAWSNAMKRKHGNDA